MHGIMVSPRPPAHLAHVELFHLPPTCPPAALDVAFAPELLKQPQSRIIGSCAIALEPSGNRHFVFHHDGASRFGKPHVLLSARARARAGTRNGRAAQLLTGVTGRCPRFAR